MDNHLTFAEWQSSRGISPWVYKKPHIRFGIEDVTQAINGMSDLWAKLQVTMSVVARNFKDLALALHNEED